MTFIRLLKKNLLNNLYFFKYVKDFSKSYVIAQAVLAIMNGVTPLIYMILPKLIIDEIISGNDFDLIIKYICIYFFIQVFATVINIFLEHKFINLNGHLYAMHFLLLINKKVVTLDMSQLDNPETHQKIALAQDIIYKGIGNNLIDSFFQAISNIILIISTVTIIIVADSRLLIVIAFFTAISFILNNIAELWQIKFRDENMYLTRVINYYIQILGDKKNIKEMKVYGFVEWIMKKYKKTLEYLKQRLNKLYKISISINITSSVADIIKNSGIYLYLAWITFNKNISVGSFTQCFSATNQLSNSLVSLVTFLTKLNINGKYIESFREFMELESEIYKQYNDNNLKQKTISIEEVLKNNDFVIKFENVYFSYPNSNEYVLENFNCTFETGKLYVILGENGAGKTTLINLICRLYEPTSGFIYLNDIPINNIDYIQYKQLFGTVFQDFKCFSFTIGENIALSEYDKNNLNSIKKINKHLTYSGLLNKVNTFDKGLETHLEKIFHDDGIILSGGENQKLALTRALYRESPILILDEPSSALDPLAEDDLIRRIENLSSSKMIIYVSHRMTCANKADHIIFIKNKKIHEEGTHKQLMGNNGEYAKFYLSQARHYTSL